MENAFLYSSKVFTYSIHHYEDGYFPGTGMNMTLLIDQVVNTDLTSGLYRRFAQVSILVIAMTVVYFYLSR